MYPEDSRALWLTLSVLLMALPAYVVAARTLLKGGA